MYTILKDNKYEANFGTGGLSLVNLKGMSRIKLEGEIYLNNGESHPEIIGKLFVASTYLSFSSPDPATD